LEHHNLNNFNQANWRVHHYYEAQLATFMQTWVKNLMPGDVVFLKGNLGAGKTTLVRYALRALGFQGQVKSPSYTIVESYEVGGYSIHHFDLYRISDPQELLFIGLEAYLDEAAIVFVEWPELGQGVLPKPNWTIELEADPKNPQRRILRIAHHAQH